VVVALKSALIADVDGQNVAFAGRVPDFMLIMESEDAAEGIRSFIERREADFKGK